MVGVPCRVYGSRGLGIRAWLLRLVDLGFRVSGLDFSRFGSGVWSVIAKRLILGTWVLCGLSRVQGLVFSSRRPPVEARVFGVQGLGLRMVWRVDGLEAPGFYVDSAAKKMSASWCAGSPSPSSGP